MTKQDDANLNVNNPLNLRSESINGGRQLKYKHVDQNFLNLVRLASTWSARVYLRNEMVRHRGGPWVAVVDDITAADEPGDDLTRWFPLSGIMGRAAYSLATPGQPQTVDLAWNPIIPAFNPFFTDVGITYSTADGSFVFDYPGLWSILLQGSLNHNSSNSGRTTNIRLFNVTQGIASGSFAYGVGRNVEDTVISQDMRLPVAVASIGDTFRIEIGGGDTLSGAVWTSLSKSFTQMHYA